jgi:peroxiredoxin
MPLVSGVTISGTMVDSSFFKNKVTLLNFMYLGCSPCMEETKELSNLNDQFNHSEFQILCVSPHTKEQLRAFLSSEKSDYSDLRKYYGIDKIKYEVLPECEHEDVHKTKHTDGNTYIQPECDRISKSYRVNGYPESFLIDQNGIIRKVYQGFDKNDSTFRKRITDDINNLLK